jgi:hypothetical protein
MEVWLPEEISSEDWNLVIAYAHLAEGIGIEKRKATRPTPGY